MLFYNRVCLFDIFGYAGLDSFAYRLRQNLVLKRNEGKLKFRDAADALGVAFEKDFKIC